MTKTYLNTTIATYETIRPMVQYMRFVKLSKNHSISHYYRHPHFVFL